MDMLDVLDMLDDIDLPDEGRPDRHAVIHRHRLDPLQDIHNPILFKQRYRFSQENVRTITEMVRPIFDINNNRRPPCTAEQIVCSSLELLAGGQYFRTNADASGMCKTTSMKNLYRYKFVSFILILT